MNFIFIKKAKIRNKIIFEKWIKIIVKYFKSFKFIVILLIFAFIIDII